MQLNPVQPFLGLMALLLTGYGIFVLPFSDPLNRICGLLTLWPSKVAASGVRIFSPGHSQGVQRFFDDGFHTCRRWAWGALYCDEHLRMNAQERKRRTEQAPALGSVYEPALSFRRQ